MESLTGSGPGEIIHTYFDGREGLIVDFSPSMVLPYGSWVILIGIFLEGLSAFGVDQVADQRYISAKSERASQWGAAVNLGAMWIVIPGLLMIGVGLYAYFTQHPTELGNGTLSEILVSDPKVADRAMPDFVRLHFPPGLAGLFLAALMECSILGLSLRRDLISCAPRSITPPAIGLIGNSRRLDKLQRVSACRN